MPHCKQLPWVRHCAHGLWPGTRRTGLGPEFHATASGQECVSLVSLTRLHQGVCVSLMHFDRYGESRVCVSLVRFSCQSLVCMPHCKQLPWARHCAHGLWPGMHHNVDGGCTTASGQESGWRLHHGLWPGMRHNVDGRYTTASGQESGWRFYSLVSPLGWRAAVSLTRLHQGV